MSNPRPDTLTGTAVSNASRAELAMEREMSEPPLGEGRAPAKVILVGEHAVVYGQPAIALPVPSLEARARVFAIETGPTRLLAHFPPAEARPPLELDLLSAADDEALAAAARAALRYAGRTERTPWRIELTSQVPSGRGLGSSAAVAAAVVRAIGVAAEQDWDVQTVADLALEGERRAHGRPSGIDNTVVAFGCPIRFHQGRAEPLRVAAPLGFLVADSGRRGATAELVARVREASEARPGTYADWFARIGRLVDESAVAIARGNPSRLGRLMDLNHLILQAMRVSTPELDALVAAARAAGARGAKLAGSGGGGAIIALVDAADSAAVQAALIGAGALDMIRVELPASAADSVQDPASAAAATR